MTHQYTLSVVRHTGVMLKSLTPSYLFVTFPLKITFPLKKKTINFLNFEIYAVSLNYLK